MQIKTTPLLTVKIFLLSALVYVQASPAELAPNALVEQIIAEFYGRLDANDSSGAEGSAYLSQQFEAHVVPHLDLDVIARWLTGQKWAKSTNENRERFVAILQRYITDTYAMALARGRNAQIEILPMQNIDGDRSTVIAQLTQGDGTVFKITFRLFRNSHAWKIIDVAVDGVSLGKTLRAELRNSLRNGGIVAATTYLKARKIQ